MLNSDALNSLINGCRVETYTFSCVYIYGGYLAGIVQVVEQWTVM